MKAELRDYRTIVSDNRRWRGFQHRPGDVVVATPPKCGTTWMQTIVATLLFPDGDLPAPVMVLSPWIDMRRLPIGDVLAGLEAQQHRRSMKTHTPADGIPWFETASYIVVGRDGRDAFMSFVNHMANMRPDVIMAMAASAIEEGIELTGEIPPSPDDIHAFFAYWLEEGFLFDFVASFWAQRDEPNVLFVHYNDLKVDLDREMRRVAGFLGIEIDEARWPAMVERCTFESMRARADEIGPFADVFQGGAESFLYKGTNDRWRDVLTPDELAAYEQRAAEILPADARAWLAGDAVSPD